jgi:LysR family transcriptional regulator, low CO2-responsive transcriptional regulator
MKAPFDSRQLRAFVTLAKTGSFTIAAKELFLSQSAVSHSIKALEGETGCRLFDRVGKKIALTSHGEQLLHDAEKILQDMDAARTSLEQLKKWGRTRLRIGASLTACQYILPTVLRQFQEQFPQCVIHIASADTSEATDSLRNNEIDLGLILKPRNDEQVEFHPLFTDELSFIVAPSHPWADGGVNRPEIPKQKYILYNKSSYTFRMVKEYFQVENVALNTVIELASMEAIKSLVKLGLGVSILAPWIAKQELNEKSLVALPLGRRKLKRTWGIAHREGRPLNIAEATFLKFCQSAADDLAKDL